MHTLCPVRALSAYLAAKITVHQTEQLFVCYEENTKGTLSQSTLGYAAAGRPTTDGAEAHQGYGHFMGAVEKGLCCCKLSNTDDFHEVLQNHHQWGL